jgi:hypothetical protein
MSIVSHLHHFFNVETCQSSIHTLRWNDRPLQCPRCEESAKYRGEPLRDTMRCATLSA